MSAFADEFNAMRAVAYAEQEMKRRAIADRYNNESQTALQVREDLTSYMRHAEKWEYDAWLTGFLKQGGKPTHFYEYRMPTAKWFVPLTDFVVRPLYGSMSLHIIVPKGIHLLGGSTGHNSVFITTVEGTFLFQGFHDSRPHANPGFVPVYTDTEVLA